MIERSAQAARKSLGKDPFAARGPPPDRSRRTRPGNVAEVSPGRIPPPGGQAGVSVSECGQAGVSERVRAGAGANKPGFNRIFH